MKWIIQIFSLLVIVISSHTVFAQSKVDEHIRLREGDHAYKSGQYEEAEIQYRQANQLKNKSTTTYNLGNSVFQQQRFEEAVRHFTDAAQSTDDPKIKAQAYHNLGNAYMSSENLEEGVKSYIESLKLNPEDMDTKKNLTMALQKLEQQRQQQQQEQQDQQQQEQQEQEQQPQPQDQQQQEQEQPQESQPQEEKRDLNKEEAEELLKIIEEEDKKVQEKLRKTQDNKKKPKKDW